MGNNRFFHIPSKGKIAQLTSLQEALNFFKKGENIWLDFDDPSKEHLDALLEPLGIHPLSIEDCLDENQIPKIEDFPGNTFVLFNTYSHLKDDIAIDEIDFILGNHFLVTVRGHYVKDKNFFDKLDETMQRHAPLINKGPEFIFYLILDYIVERKFNTVEQLQEDIDTAEEMILKEPEKFKPEELLKIRGRLLSLRKSLYHEREILIKICRKDSPYIGEKAILYFRDTYDHLSKFFEFIEINREMITSMMELHLSGINNRMAALSNQTNMVMKRLTVIMTIFMPLTLLSGIGGMSEYSAITGGSDKWLITYPTFLVAMGVLGYANYWLLKRFNWI